MKAQFCPFVSRVPTKEQLECANQFSKPSLYFRPKYVIFWIPCFRPGLVFWNVITGVEPSCILP